VGFADRAAVVDEQMAENRPLGAGNDRHETRLDAIAIFCLPDQPEPVGDAKDMGVDDDALIFPERVSQDDVRGFSGNAVERQQIVHRIRHAAAEPLTDGPAGEFKAAGLVSVESCGSNDRLDFRQGSAGEFSGRPIFFKERRGDFVNPLVRTLRGENGGDEQLQRTAIGEGTDGARIRSV